MDEETHNCQACHGLGDFSCILGCHTISCDECDGTGELNANDEPTGHTRIV